MQKFLLLVFVLFLSSCSETLQDKAINIIKKDLNDPNSIEILEFKETSEIDPRISATKTKFYHLDYTAKNKVGGRVRSKAFFISKNKGGIYIFPNKVFSLKFDSIENFIKKEVKQGELPEKETLALVSVLAGSEKFFDFMGIDSAIQLVKTKEQDLEKVTGLDNGNKAIYELYLGSIKAEFTYIKNQCRLILE